MSNCRRCSVEKTALTSAKDEVARQARLLARYADVPHRARRIQDDLTYAKATVAEAQERIDQGHEHDDLLSSQHWTKKR